MGKACPMTFCRHIFLCKIASQPSPVLCNIFFGEIKLFQCWFLLHCSQVLGGQPGAYSLFATTDESHWKNIRKGTSPAFSPANIRRYFHAARPIVETMVQGVGSAAVDSSDSGVSLEPLLLSMQMKVSVSVLFGCDVSVLTAQHPEFISDVMCWLGEANEAIRNPFKKVFMDSWLSVWVSPVSL